MRKIPLFCAAILGGVGATGAYAADLGENTTVGGLTYFDFSHISLQNDNAAGQKIDVPPTGTGFDIKRFYIIIDHRFNDVWSADLTTDAQYSTASTASVPNGNGGTTTVLTNQNTSGGVTEVMIKKLYLQGAFDKGFVLRIGSANTPWIPFVEQLNGYRFVEKLTLDRLGLGQTADWGVNASGSFGDHDLVTYSASVLNGGGYKNPTRTKDVDYEGRLAVKPINWLTIGAGFYSGHLGQVTATNESNPTNTATRLDGVIAVTFSGLRVGAEYFSAKNYKTVNNVTAAAWGTSSVVTASGAPPVSDKAEGFSGWASYAFNEQWSVFGRYDQAKLSKDVAPNLKDTYFNVGVDYKPIKQLDFALVYKNDKVENGSASLSGANANSSYTIGGATAAGEGTYDEIGIFAQWSF